MRISDLNKQLNETVYITPKSMKGIGKFNELMGDDEDIIAWSGDTINVPNKLKSKVIKTLNKLNIEYDIEK